MVPDTFGFLYPEVNDSLCVDCGLCEKICAFHEDYDKSLNLAKPLAYAAKHKNPEEITASQSGAAFVALSDIILSQGGVVYGAGYTGHFRVVHKKATTNRKNIESLERPNSSDRPDHQRHTTWLSVGLMLS